MADNSSEHSDTVQDIEYGGAASGSGSSLFERALDQYLARLKADGKTGDLFLAHCSEYKALNDASAITRAIATKFERQWSETKVPRSRRILQGFVDVQKTFDGVAGTLTSKDPTQISGAVWMALKFVAESVDRYYEVYETIAVAIHEIGKELAVITTYNILYGEPPKEFEEVFCDSYIGFFGFWSAIYKELHRRSELSILCHVYYVPLIDHGDNHPGISRAFGAIGGTGGRRLRKHMDIMRKNADAVKGAMENWQNRCSEGMKLKQELAGFLGSAVETGSQAIHDGIGNKLEDECSRWVFADSRYRKWKSGEDSNAIWVYAPPGSGKSTLCQSVVRRLRADTPSVAVAAYYFHFDDVSSTLNVVLKALVAQLWAEWAERHPLETPLGFSMLRQLTDEKKHGDTTSRALMMLDKLITGLREVYLFIDGVDEEVAKKGDIRATASRARGDCPRSTLDVLDKLDRYINPTTTDRTKSVRIWISSQDVLYTKEKFAHYAHFDIKDAVKAGIQCYLAYAVEQLASKFQLTQDHRDFISVQLTHRVESNFLWAHLLICELMGAPSLSAMADILEQGWTADLDDYYSRFLTRLSMSDQTAAPVTCDILSIVTFARRPLTVGEIQEAVAILRSGCRAGGSINESHKPFFHTFHTLCPLIQIAETKSLHSSTVSQASATSPHATAADEEAYVSRPCRLFHASLASFLRRRAHLICDDEETQRRYGRFRVCPLRIGDACLLYLTQKRYIHLWTKLPGGATWTDAEGQPVSQHRFLTYSAKHWDKHLDLVGLYGDDDSMLLLPTSVIMNAIEKLKSHFHDRVQHFIRSPCFQTCIQVQSLWIAGSFNMYTVYNGDGTCYRGTRQSLPSWLAAAGSERLTQDYQQFWWDWHPFLSYATSNDTNNPYLSCIGEVDRCWWNSLPEGSFMANLQSRYHCFRFESPIARALQTEGHIRALSPCSAIVTRHDVKTLRLISSSEGKLTFLLEVWTSCDGTPASLLDIQTLVIEEKVCRLALYKPTDTEDTAQSVSWPTSLAAFSDDGYCLRIGTQPLVPDAAGKYHCFSGVDGRSERYADEIAGREGVVTLASRLGPLARRQTSVGNTPLEKSHRQECDDHMKSDEWQSDGDGANSGSEISDDLEDGGCQDLSDCSSNADDALAESDAEGEWDENGYFQHPAIRGQGLVSDDDDTDRNSDSDSDRSDHCSEGEDPDGYADSDVDEDIDPSAFSYGQMRPYGADYLEAGDYMRRKNSGAKSGRTHQQNSMRIFLPGGRTFWFYKATSSSLTQSPPVLHPDLPLVVWPLDEQEMLFVDYDANTYFICQLRRSGMSSVGPRQQIHGVEGETVGLASEDQHLRMSRCHFTDDGSHLYIVSFDYEPTRGVTSNGPSPPPHMGLRVDAYRLCGKKPTRALPHWLYTSVFQLDGLEQVKLSGTPSFPCTLTWTNDSLYITWSSAVLTVHRIPLPLQPESSPDLNTSPLRPTKTVPLPASAEFRDVFLFPPGDTHDEYQVILGGQNYAREEIENPAVRRAVPVGCALNADHLGEWVPMPDGGRGIDGDGRLMIPLESFDPDIDCVVDEFVWLE